MRRLAGTLVALAMLIGVALPVSAATGTAIVLDGQQTAVATDGEAGLVPVDQFAKALGAEYTWNATRQEATVVLGHRSIVLWAGSPKAVVNGAIRTLGAAPSLRGETLLAPAGFMAEALGLYVAGEKDGALVLHTGLGLIQGAKAPEFAGDQIISTRSILTAVGIDGNNPDNSLDLSLNLEQEIHTYQDELMLKMHVEASDEAPMTIQMAYVNGQTYLKEAEKNWVATGQPSPLPLMNMLNSQYAEIWADSATPENPELAKAVVTVTGTSELDGVKVVNVMISMTESGVMPALAVGMGLDNVPEDQNVDVDIRTYVQTYAIDPETGVIHDAQTALHIVAADDEGTSLDFQMLSQLRVQPVSVPLELPADFPVK